MNQVICIGSSSKDVFLPTGDGVVFDTPEDLTSQKKLAFELGAKFQIDEIIETPGGCAANVAQGLARLGIKSGCYTKVGGDENGKWIMQEMKSGGVDTSLVQVDNSCASDLSHIIVDTKSKEHLIFFNRKANERLRIDTGKLSDTEWLFLSALNGPWEQYIEGIIELINERGIKLAFNPGQRNIAKSPEMVIKIIENCDVLILNKDEAIEILMLAENEFPNLEKGKLNNEIFLMEKLININDSMIIAITDGENGAWVGNGRDIFYAKSPEKNVVDTLGAGDGFSSGFLAAYVSGKGIEECLKSGLLNGKNVTRFYGSKEGLLYVDIMEERISEVSIKKII